MAQNEDTSTNSNKPIEFFNLTISQLFIVVVVGIIVASLFTGFPMGFVPDFTAGPVPTRAAKPTNTPIIFPTPTTSGILKIGIVSGHWGSDSGAVCDDGLTEAEVNQTVATLVQKKLTLLGYSVELLREFDQNLTGYQAAALVSIHADSCNYINNEATGFKVATALARSNRESSTRLVACIRNRYAQITQLPHHSTSLTPDMTSYHAFAEIDIETPAAIIETGFLNLDRQFLVENPDTVADGIVSGILCFLNNESISPTPTAGTE